MCPILLVPAFKYAKLCGCLSLNRRNALLRRRTIQAVALLSVLLGLFSIIGHQAHAQGNTPTPSPVAPQEDTRGGRVELIQPLSNQILVGTIQIIGTALSPDFDHYELAWSSDPALNEGSWQPVQPPVFQQVSGSILGVWDTTRVPDGQYLIRLRMVRLDETLLETHVRVQVANATKTPTATMTPRPTSTLLPGPATVGPSPTPLIQQPPTRTPRPTQTPGGPTSTPMSLSDADSPFRPDRLRGAACNGVIWTFAAFLALGIYGIIRTARRGRLWIAWRNFRRDLVGPLLDSLRRGK